MIKIDTLVLGMYAANCYLLWKDDHVLIVDPGSLNPKIKEKIISANGIVDGIYLTHGHFDHIAGVDALVETFQVPVYINALETSFLTDPKLNVSYGGKEIVLKTAAIGLQPGKQSIQSFSFELIDAPGHSIGSSIMLWENYMICGDVLFKGSIGRMDLITGSNTQMKQTLQRIKKLDPSYIVLPGHGEPTTLLEELNTNPYLIS